MCLALPGKIVSVEGSSALVDYDGVTRNVDISLIEHIVVGSWVLVHAGFAIQVVDEEVAKGMYHLLDEVDKK
jgi:hydrogenase expression/formation protein HypC